MRLALILSISLFAPALIACDSGEIDGVEDPTIANLEPPDNPELCAPACEVLTGECNVADDAGDVEILRGCVADCLAGGFTDVELECLAASDCANSSDCL